MSIKDLKNSNFVLNADETIGEAMLRITENKRGSIAVVDEQFKLCGVASDGDIRRALLEGSTKLTPVSQIINTSPTIISKKGESNGSKSDKIFEKEGNINIIPVVDGDNKLIEIVVRNPDE